MNWTESLFGFVRTYDGSILLGLCVVALFLALANLCLLLKLGKLSKYRKAVLATTDRSALADTEELARRLEGLEERTSRLDERQSALDDKLVASVQKVGLVRFDAFADVGGEQSFALALLDRQMSGVVLSNLYSRSDSRIYAKEITGGQSQHALTDEEMEALRRAGSAER